MSENNCSSGCAGCTESCGFNGSATITLELDNGVQQECVVVTIFEAAGRKYIALLPVDEQGRNEDGEVYLYRFDDSGMEPTLDNIADDEEYEAASDGFDEWMDSQEYDDLVYYDEESEEDGSGQ